MTAKLIEQYDEHKSPKLSIQNVSLTLRKDSISCHPFTNPIQPNSVHTLQRPPFTEDSAQCANYNPATYISYHILMCYNQSD